MSHLDTVRRDMTPFIGYPESVAARQADVCRAGLLVGIEAPDGPAHYVEASA